MKTVKTLLQRDRRSKRVGGLDYMGDLRGRGK